MGNIEAIRERVIVKRDNPEKVTAGGIIIPENSEQPTNQGTVFSVLPNDDGIEVGDKVLFHQYSGQEIKHDGEEYTVFKLENVLCKVV